MSFDELMRDLMQGAEESDMRRDVANSMLATFSAPTPTYSSGGSKSGGKNESGSNNSNRTGGGSNTGVVVKGGPRLSAFLKAEAAQESGGNYEAVGVQTQYGTALGKYQILDSNFVGPGGWDKETLGRDISRGFYMHHPKAQERIAQGKLSQYFRRYGPIGAAKSWYAGEGNHDTYSDSPQYGGPSINDYAQEVYNRMMDILNHRH